jgi:hypothetical protein
VTIGISFSNYAVHRRELGLPGATTSAVSQAVSAGRIIPEEDGSIIPEKADAEWARNTRPRTGTGRTRIPDAPELWNFTEETIKPDADDAAVNTDAATTESKQRHQPKAVNVGGTTLLQARTAHEIIKAQRSKLGLAKDRNQMIDRDQALAHVFKLARAERESWLQWPSRVAGSLAEQLGIDAHKFIFLLENAVHQHLNELGEPQINIGNGDVVRG